MKFLKHPCGVFQKRWLKKSLLIMKLTFIIVLISCMQVSAKTYSQGVTINLKSVELKKALAAIEKHSDFRFLYSERLIAKNDKVDVQVSNASISQVMDKLLSGTDLSYKKLGNNLIVLVQKNEQVQDIFVKGQVIDKATGKPLAGVTIQIKGSNSGTSTDASGNYSINVPEKAVLEISSIGYDNIEIPVNGREVINISMQVSTTGLNEVVVIGYGTQKKVDLTGSIATVTSEKLDSRPLVNLGDGLEGLIPNLNVNLGNGQPGTGASYNIRGLTTMNNGSATTGSPLILVDGVQRDPNLIDPNDVASVTVLKDAASAAIYGGRAAFGVILITTKTGKKGKTQISYTGNYTTSRPTNLPEYVNSDGYIKLFNSAQRTGALTGGYTSSDPLTALDSSMAAAYRADPANNPDAYPDPGNPIRYRYVGNTDWVKVLYPGWAPQQEHHLSISGGEGKTTYSANLGYFTQDGLEKVANQVYKRITPNLKINSDVTNWLTVNLNMSMTHIDNDASAPTWINQGGGMDSR